MERLKRINAILMAVIVVLCIASGAMSYLYLSSSSTSSKATESEQSQQQNTARSLYSEYELGKIDQAIAQEEKNSQTQYDSGTGGKLIPIKAGTGFRNGSQDMYVPGTYELHTYCLGKGSLDIKLTIANQSQTGVMQCTSIFTSPSVLAVKNADEQATGFVDIKASSDAEGRFGYALVKVKE